MVRMSDSTMEQTPEERITRESILQTIRRRETIEQQIQSLGDILKSNNVGMNDPLTDAEGFPRNDIDVYQVRIARHGIICLQNDFKAVSKEIESQLEKYHHQWKLDGDVTPMDLDDVTNEPQSPPIVKVNLVSDGSPAFHAGLRIGDEILTFGSINSENFSNIKDIGAVVQRSQGKILPVKVKRNSAVVQLTLIPGPWSGKGLLGCNIIPIE